MQDLRPTAPDAAAGERRHRRSYPPLAVKCPRCESLNTKFCYYNNYNLSQPRHFCKSCRRYWTKGGVLRNVPVGGGCRKPKRSSSKPKPKPSSSPRRRADPKPDTGTPAPEAGNNGDQLPGAESFNRTAAPAVIPDAWSFAGLMNASNPAILGGFSFADLAGNGRVAFELEEEEKAAEEMRMKEGFGFGFGFGEFELAQGELDSRRGNGGLTALEWESNGDGGLFDLTGWPDHDQGGYWSRCPWQDDGRSLYLP